MTTGLVCRPIALDPMMPHQSECAFSTTLVQALCDMMRGRFNLGVPVAQAGHALRQARWLLHQVSFAPQTLRLAFALASPASFFALCTPVAAACWTRVTVLS